MKSIQQMPFFVFVSRKMLLHLCIVKRVYLKNNEKIMIRQYIQFFLTIAILLQISVVGVAQSWQKSYGNSTNNQEGKAIVATKDGGYIVAFTDDEVSGGIKRNLRVMKIDGDGNKQWDKLISNSYIFEPSKMEATTDGNYVIVGKQKLLNADYDPFITKINHLGEVIWGPTKFGTTGEEDNATALKVTSNNEYIVAGNHTISNTNSDVFWVKYDANGQVLTTPKTYQTDLKEYVNCITQSPDGGIVMVGKASHVSRPDGAFILKTNAALDVEAAYSKDLTTISNFGKEIYSVVFLGGENYFFLTQSESQNLISIINARITSTGVISQSSKTFSSLVVDVVITNQIAITPDGNAIISASILETGNPAYTDFVILKTNPFTCDSLWTKRINVSTLDIPFGIIPTNVGGAVMAGSIDVGGGSAFPNVFVTKIDGNGNINNNIINGLVFEDLNGNCTKDLNERYLKGWIIKSVGPKTYFATTDTAGYYQINQDTGTYFITAIPPSKYWTVCQSSFNVTLKNNQIFYVPSFAARSKTDCSDLEIDISTPTIKHCANTEYTIAYTNPGTVLAKDAYAIIDFDKKLSILGSSTQWSAQNGNVLRFNLGDIAPGNFGTFKVFTKSSCDTKAIGQTYQVNAHIYPDSNCLTSAASWNKSSIQITGKCDGDSVRFNFINKGIAPSTPNELKYEIVEDELIFLQRPIIQSLLPQESIELAFAATGGTFRAISNQSTNHPGKSRPTISIEGCEATNATKQSKGYVIQYAEDDEELFKVIDNSESSIAPIALEKRGYPKGYGSENYIENNTELKYVLSFTNESSDTISRIVIIDSLPATLAAETFRFGAASFPYKWELYNKGIVKFIMDSIKLLPNERGFIKFSIYPKVELQLGTRICNNANVIFDDLTVAQTNTVCHTIGLNFIKIITSNSELPNVHVDVKVFPNPIKDFAIIEIQGMDLKEGRFSLYDLEGKLKYSQNILSNSFQVSSADLPSGLYVFKIESKNQLVNSGKVIIR